MPYIFFYISLFVTWIVFAAVSRIIHLDIRHFVIGIATIAYAAVFDTVLGEINGLYHYISPGESLTYIILSALLIYPFINVIYTAFLPSKPKPAFFYTIAWIAAMLLFEYLSVQAGTIVFTGWNPLPWSIITYVATFTWLYLLYRYATQKMSVMSHS